MCYNNYSTTDDYYPYQITIGSDSETKVSVAAQALLGDSMSYIHCTVCELCLITAKGDNYQKFSMGKEVSELLHHLVKSRSRSQPFTDLSVNVVTRLHTLDFELIRGEGTLVLVSGW